MVFLGVICWIEQSDIILGWCQFLSDFWEMWGQSLFFCRSIILGILVMAY